VDQRACYEEAKIMARRALVFVPGNEEHDYLRTMTGSEREAA
jgi:hypothetical protein